VPAINWLFKPQSPALITINCFQLPLIIPHTAAFVKHSVAVCMRFGANPGKEIIEAARLFGLNVTEAQSHFPPNKVRCLGAIRNAPP
jgi:hypothetical protein